MDWIHTDSNRDKWWTLVNTSCISWLDEKLSASQEGLCSVGLYCYYYYYYYYCCCNDSEQCHNVCTCRSSLTYTNNNFVSRNTRYAWTLSHCSVTPPVDSNQIVAILQRRSCTNHRLLAITMMFRENNWVNLQQRILLETFSGYFYSKTIQMHNISNLFYSGTKL
jgi:hypothetical protein